MLCCDVPRRPHRCACSSCGALLAQHKSLRGPRGAMIFYRKGVRSVDKKGNKSASPTLACSPPRPQLVAPSPAFAHPARSPHVLCVCAPSPAAMYDLEAKVNSAVFPGLQGGPHNHTISALATALKQVRAPPRPPAKCNDLPP